MNYASSLKVAVATAALIAGSGAAFAADAPIYDKGVVAPAPVVAPLWSWTGFYVGINGGYGWGNIDDDDNGLFGPTTYNLDADGGVIGGQIGYNWQMDRFVFGVESDAQYANLSSTNNQLFDFDGDGTADDSLGIEAELNWFGTTRLRAGFAPGRFLIFATGGLAYGDADVGYSFNGDVNDVFLSSRDDETRLGWTVGGGVEGAITDNVTAKLEYLYVDLGDQDNAYRYTSAGTAIGTFSSSTQFEAHILRAGLNYKF